MVWRAAVSDVADECMKQGRATSGADHRQRAHPFDGLSTQRAGAGRVRSAAGRASANGDRLNLGGSMPSPRRGGADKIAVEPRFERANRANRRRRRSVGQPCVVPIHTGPLRYISHLDYISFRYVGSMYLAIAT